MDKVVRKIIADQPRVTHFSIPWDSTEAMPEANEEGEGEGEVVSFEGMSEEEEEGFSDEENSGSLSDDMESSEGMNVEDKGKMTFVFS